MNTELIGWASAALLLTTIVQQVYTQWATRSSEGVSPWLFVGQTLSSLGFAVYSGMTGNMVFLTVNIALLLSALTGQVIYWRNCRRQARDQGEQPAPRGGTQRARC